MSNTTVRLDSLALVLTMLAGVACHPGGAGGGATPAPAEYVPTSVMATTLNEAPRDWQMLDEVNDSVPGISVARAEREVLHGRAPVATTVVAVIDDGIDTLHAGLIASLWTRPAHAPPDGHPNERHGWNFIGGAGGGDVNYDTDELTRLAASCARTHSDSIAAPLPVSCPKLEDEVNTRHSAAEARLPGLDQMERVVKDAYATLQRNVGTDTLSVDRVKAISPSDSTVARARDVYLRLAAQGVSSLAIFEDAIGSMRQEVKYTYNVDFDPRNIVGDDYANVHQWQYGNSDVMGPDPFHGTHVSGIIGAVRGSGAGIAGIAPRVRIMLVRAVPDGGDERDKDVANAIRFAVDHGARVINMSFGKGFSPQKAAVDDAVRYADSHGVLLVHAAGNNGKNLDSSATYPTRTYLGGGSAQNWIEVGASSWSGGDHLAANFSDYGQTTVDVFAPGVAILSTVPGNKYERADGTSMAAPVVTGLAALIWDYYPRLSAARVKQIILASAMRYPTQMVIKPGTKDEMVPFGTLSATGGIVNAYAAFRLLQRGGGAG